MIILDTHIWLWWINNDIKSLTANRVKLIEQEDIVAVSAISCFEVAWLNKHNKIVLPIEINEWFNLALDGSNIDIIPITPKIACKAVDLPEHHTDPQDRIIIATALECKAKLLSIDKKFKLYKELKGFLI